MDFRDLIGRHRESHADVTIAALPVTADQCSGLGILRVDKAGRVVGFVEKPETKPQLEAHSTPSEWIERQGIGDRDRRYLASMGIYLFKREILFKLLKEPPLATDFGKEIFPRSIRSQHVQVHVFNGYWEDLGTIRSYHEASLALASEHPPFDFHSRDGVIYTRMRFLPASRVSGASLSQCLVSDGCVIQTGTRIERCVVGVRSRIGRDVTMRNSVVIGADRFETDAERAANERRGIPNFGVADGSLIENAILDKDCRIGRNVRIVNEQRQENFEAENYVIRDGIVVIPKATTIPDGTVI